MIRHAADNQPLEIPERHLKSWQELVTDVAQFVSVPAALIMRVYEPHIEVLVANQSEGNPYHPGHAEVLWGSGLYCETVLKTQAPLLVPNALTDALWKDNPDVHLNMISYLGLPIMLPDGKPFGTICVLDSKENAYSPLVGRFMAHMRNLVQHDLEILHANRVLGDQNRQLTDYFKELQVLRGMVTICASCRSIRDAQEQWHSVEHYLVKHPEATFSHGLCPSCIRKLYPEETQP